MTSHAAQARTVDAVFLVASSRSAAAIHREQFYVSISRGRQACHIFTNDKMLLRDRIARTNKRQAALEMLGEALILQGLVPTPAKARRLFRLRRLPNATRMARPRRTSLRDRMAAISLRVVQTLDTWARKTRTRLIPDTTARGPPVGASRGGLADFRGPFVPSCPASSLTQSKAPSAMPTSKTPLVASAQTPPICIVESDAFHLALALDFALRDGRVHGFPYAHLLSYLYEINPEAALHPDAPPDRFSLWFSTHDVTLIGWRLSALAPLLRQGKVASVLAIDARYYELSAAGPFVAEIRVKLAQTAD